MISLLLDRSPVLRRSIRSDIVALSMIWTGWVIVRVALPRIFLLRSMDASESATNVVVDQDAKGISIWLKICCSESGADVSIMIYSLSLMLDFLMMFSLSL